MEKEKDFLSLNDLTAQSHDFKKKWYGIAEKAEALKGFKSGFEEDFKAAVKSVYDEVDACKEYIDVFEHSLKHYFPDQRNDITWNTKKVFRHLEDLRVMAKKDYEVLESSKDLSQNLKKLQADLEKANKKFKTVEKKSGDECRKYFDMKNDYTRDLQAIEEKINKKLEKIKGKFMKMTTPIVEGHIIRLESKEVSPEDLFVLLSENPGDSEKISLVIKKGGIFGRKSETDLAKTSVLKYVSEEIMEGVAPITKEKGQYISKLKSEYADLPKLEKACEEAEKKRKRLEKPVEDLREKIGDIRRSEVFKFSDYDGILETMEQYLDKIGEAEKDVEAYIDFALVNLKGFVELETDVEKRNLLAERKQLKEKTARFEKEAKEAKEALTAKTQELNKILAAKEEFEKKVAEASEKVKILEKEKSDIKRSAEAINKKVVEFEKHFIKTIRNLESEMQTKISDITLKELGGRLTSKGEPKSARAKEEKNVGEKVDVLREKK